MSETVTVQAAALKALIWYAADNKSAADSQFVCSDIEQDASDAAFSRVVDALGIDIEGLMS